MEKNKIIIIIAGIILLLININFFFNKIAFMPFFVIIILFMALPFLVDFFKKQARDKEMEAHFPDFVRNIVAAVRSGMPVPKAIMHVADTEYGALTPYVKKLANQVEWGIPVYQAMKTFAKETKNIVIKRAVSTVMEAEKSGGNIEDVLESVTSSVLKIKQIKEKRKAEIHTEIIQGYIIFAVFLGIMIVIQNIVVPTMLGIQAEEGAKALIKVNLGTLTRTAAISFESPKLLFFSVLDYLSTLKGVLVALGLIQGFFMGAMMGKLAEDDFKAGFKHSLVLMVVAFIVITFAQGYV